MVGLRGPNLTHRLGSAKIVVPSFDRFDDPFGDRVPGQRFHVRKDPTVVRQASELLIRQLQAKWNRPPSRRAPFSGARPN